MPRVGVDGGGGGNTEKITKEQQHQHQQQQQQQQEQNVAGFTGWLGGAARAMTGGSASNYVVLGGTRYGLRLSQDSLPPAISREESLDRRRKRNSQESESRERLTDATEATKQSLELIASDCCCIGPRTRLLPLGSRIPLSWTGSSSSGAGAGGGGSSSNNNSNNSSAIGSPSIGNAIPRQQQYHHHHHHNHHQVGGTVTAAAAAAAAQPPNSNANNSRCWPSSNNSYTTAAAAEQQQLRQPQPQAVVVSSSQGALGIRQLQQTNSISSPFASVSSSYSALSSSSSSSSSLSNSSTATTTTTANNNSNSTSNVTLINQQYQRPEQQLQILTSCTVPRQLAHWTKHQSLRLQEPAVTAVDRLQRFRWSGGGGGGSGKKSSSSRNSDKTERLRELTEKLKGTAPVPPPRRPSRHHTSSPPPLTPQPSIESCQSIAGAQSLSSQQNRQTCDNNDGRISCRSYTFSEGSHPNVPTLASGSIIKSPSPTPSLPLATIARPRQLGRSESVGDECYVDTTVKNINSDNGSSNDNANIVNDNVKNNNNNNDKNSVNSNNRHCRQYSDSIIVDNAKIIDASENEARDAIAGLMEPRLSSSSSLFPSRTGQPYRSASFGQADFNHGNNRQASSSQSIANSRRAAYAANSDDKEVRASTLPRVRRIEDNSNNSSSSLGVSVNIADAASKSLKIQEDEKLLKTNNNSSGDITSSTTIIASERNSPTPQSPRASTPSLADSAVGSSAEGLLIANNQNSSELSSSCNINEDDFRPRSDGSDSLATSSVIASPEPNEQRQQSNDVIVTVTSNDSCNGDKNFDASQINAPATTTITITDAAEQQSISKESTPKECRLDQPHEVIITPPLEELQEQHLQALRLSQASEASEAPSESSDISTLAVAQAIASATSASGSTTPTATSGAASIIPSGKLRRYRGDTSKRRKGIYITQWPEPTDVELRGKLSGQSSEERDEPPPSATPSDLSDCEGQVPRRYSKRPLRGPYGQMLEAEMAKQQPRTADIAVNLIDPGLTRQRRKVSANLSFNASSSSGSTENPPSQPCHHRTTSSPSKLEGLPGPSPELLAELLRGSSERSARVPVHRNDTRTHVVVELYDTERSYVEALQILVNKYLQTLKSPENAHLVDSAIVDEIFYQVPAILSHHEIFLEELRKRLETWELRQTIGDVFLEVFTKPDVLETYTLFLDNWKSAKKAIKTTCQAKPAFARFLETMEREHKGKLGLDQLLIKPVQKIPRYELLIQRLLKHTDTSHPDYELLTAALKEVHELVVKINCTERESLEWEQQQTTLKEVQSLVEGLAGIVTNDRAFIRHDLVSIASNQGTRKERGLFLFSDLLVITSIKRRSGTIRKPSTSTCPNSLVGVLEANKYKMLMRISLDDLEVMKAKDENLRRMAREVDYLREDCATLNQLQELAGKLHGAKQQLEDLIKEMLSQTQKQLAERNAAHSQLACLELTLNTQAGMENISVMFAKPDKRASWEESFNEAKAKLAASTDRRPIPEFVGPLPIRKTRAGLQFTCAAPTLANGQGARDVWVCNSDGYVGQVCVLSLSPEPPQVTSCNGVCNARILCVAGIPACTSVSNSCTPINSAFINNKSGVGASVQNTDTSSGNIQLDSSSSDDSDSDDIPCADTASTSLGGDASSFENGPIDEDFNQPTMWLGTEDGCVHVYNCSDNIRIKKNKVKLQHGSSVHCIIYLDNKVFISLANGDITVYTRDHSGGWNTAHPTTLQVGTVSSPVTKMLPVSGKLWCASHNTIKIFNTYTLDVEHTFIVSSDSNRPISCMASSGGLGVWISLHNSSVLKLFHAGSYECLADVNIAPTVTNMLVNCDDIIRQHKAACLRVTALLACNELLWIGTSAGVLLTVPIPHIKPSTQRMSQAPVVTGIPHGHTGHVRFLTCVEIASPPKSEPRPKTNRYSFKGSKSLVVQQSSISSTSSTGSTTSSTGGGCSNNTERGRLLVISGGDGYEDFRGPQATSELQAGREDSTNHLLLWKV